MEYGTKQLQIIEVAEGLFAKKGFAGTSIRDIAQEADINVSMISYYFGSKEKLIEALFSVRMAETETTMVNILENQDLTAMQKVNIWLDSVVGRFMFRKNFHNIVMREQLSSNRSETITAFIMDLKMRHIDLMKQLISLGIREGVFKENLDMSLMMTTIYGTVNQAIANQDFYRRLNQLEHLSEEEFNLYLLEKLKVHLKFIFINSVSNEQQGLN
ncbi:AcrR family transcriptional regulator [Dyadobacter jejuensis]|uniref:AcrR family transcriptional regulator n=1 Tax=Dyadobacter jejuensis TaxID=1082580 RepID=A0A316ANE7_9BACT|nr:TetR family transcriptional regulator [Dyadobacter jejuensis]PWJ59062.1 AcrR family transcriptional regulator [Dyadobacter jejuensis]